MITLFPSRCYNGGKQHRFEARYSGRPPSDSALHLLEMSSFFASSKHKAEIIAAGRGQVYNGDVCTWCGAVVNQPSTKGTSP